MKFGKLISVDQLPAHLAEQYPTACHVLEISDGTGRQTGWEITYRDGGSMYLADVQIVGYQIPVEAILAAAEAAERDPFGDVVKGEDGLIARLDEDPRLDASDVGAPLGPDEDPWPVEHTCPSCDSLVGTPGFCSRCC